MPKTLSRRRPPRVIDGQGVQRDIHELLASLLTHLCGEGTEHGRLPNESESAVLNWRSHRIEDITNLIDGISRISVPRASRRTVLSQLRCVRARLGALHWPDQEGELRQKIDAVISRLEHTTQRRGIPASTKRKLRRASDLPHSTRRHSPKK